MESHLQNTHFSIMIIRFCFVQEMIRRGIVNACQNIQSLGLSKLHLIFGWLNNFNLIVIVSKRIVTFDYIFLSECQWACNSTCVLWWVSIWYYSIRFGVFQITKLLCNKKQSVWRKQRIVPLNLSFGGCLGHVCPSTLFLFQFTIQIHDFRNNSSTKGLFFSDSICWCWHDKIKRFEPLIELRFNKNQLGAV